MAEDTLTPDIRSAVATGDRRPPVTLAPEGPANPEQATPAYDESNPDSIIRAAKALRDEMNAALSAREPGKAQEKKAQLMLMLGLIPATSPRYSEMANVVGSAASVQSEIDSMAAEMATTAANGGIAAAQALVVNAMQSPGVQNFFKEKLGGVDYDAMHVNVPRTGDATGVTVSEAGKLKGADVRESFSDIGFYTLSREKQNEIRKQRGEEEEHLPANQKLERIQARGDRLHRSLTEMQQYNAGVIEKSSLTRSQKDTKLAENDKYFKEAHAGVDEISGLERSVVNAPTEEMRRALTSALEQKQDQFGENLKRNIVERVLLELNMVQRMVSGGFVAEIGSITSGLVNAVTGGKGSMSPTA